MPLSRGVVPKGIPQLYLIFVVAFLFLFFSSPTDTHSAQVTLAWNPNPEPDIAGYKIHYGTSSGSYASHVDVGNHTTSTVSGLQDATKYYFAVTTYNNGGLESSYSAEVVYNPPAPSCTYSISPTTRAHPASGGTGGVNITSASGCAWTAVSNASWVLITSNSSGSGTATVNYSVSANTGTASRTGTLTIAGQTFTVTQSGVNCTYSISPTGRSFTSTGGTGTVTVTASSGCSWSASSGVTWTTITSGSSGTGNGTCTYSVDANSAGSSRTGTLTIAGKTFNITQSGVSCTYSISPTSRSFSYTGGTGTVSITTPSGCSWSASSHASWITITSGSTGSGNGTSGYSVAAHTGRSSRTGSLTIAGKTFTVTQSGVPAGTVVFAVNSGGPQYTASDGTVYQSDQNYSGGFTSTTSAAISGTTDDRLYQSERYGSFSYSIPLPNGNYTVLLRFAEIYRSAAGQRVFDVYVEGTKVISGLDIFARVGKNAAYTVSIPTTVGDGKLDIRFSTIVDNPEVSAIAVSTR